MAMMRRRRSAAADGAAMGRDSAAMLMRASPIFADPDVRLSKLPTPIGSRAKRLAPAAEALPSCAENLATNKPLARLRRFGIA